MKIHLFKNKFESEGTQFKVYCPGQYKSFPRKLMMYDNGSVKSKVSYQDICADKFIANIAHVWSNDVVNNSMVEHRVSSLSNRRGMGKSAIPYDFEIIGSFLINYNIIVNKWIDCNNTAGIFDYETGKWTGAVGQVNTELMHSPKVELNEIFVYMFND